MAHINKFLKIAFLNPGKRTKEFGRFLPQNSDTRFGDFKNFFLFHYAAKVAQIYCDLLACFEKQCLKFKTARLRIGQLLETFWPFQFDQTSDHTDKSHYFASLETSFRLMGKNSLSV